MRALHQLRAFHQLKEAYTFDMPLHRFLPIYFKRHKQMGSSDRRWASRHIYSFFRMGNALSALPDEQRLALGDFLLHTQAGAVLEQVFPQYAAQAHLPLEEKLNIIQNDFSDFNWKELFPWTTRLSAHIDAQSYAYSFFIQPDLFIRSKYPDAVIALFKEKEISYTELAAGSFALPNGTKLDQLLPPDYYEVQDLSSQFTGSYFQPKAHEAWWDCCAASGGKSLLLHALEPKVKLLVSDLRPQMLQNLAQRFERAGIHPYQSKTLDLTLDNAQVLHDYAFDGIILDAPCSGSGTWGRTPEMLHMFKTEKLANYTYLQQKIMSGIIPYLKVGQPLIYITCSVFAAENEEMVQYYTQHFPLKLERMQIIPGYLNRADTMFVARLIKT